MRVTPDLISALKALHANKDFKIFVTFLENTLTGIDYRNRTLEGNLVLRSQGAAIMVEDILKLIASAPLKNG